MGTEENIEGQPIETAPPEPAGPSATVEPEIEEVEEVVVVADPEFVSFVKPAIQSQTMRWLIVAFFAYLVKALAIPMMPQNVSNELVEATIQIMVASLDFVIPAAMVMAARARMRAHQAIQGVFK